MPNLPYSVINVFTKNGKNGNGLAVFTETDGLAKASMQSIAKRLGYSETSFVFPKPSGADYRVRFFTPEKELPFAGHPSIGTLYLLLHKGLLKKKKGFVQRIGRRSIKLSYEKGGAIFMDQGRPNFGRPIEKKAGAKIIGLKESEMAGEPMPVSTGFEMLIAPVASLDLLKKAKVSKKAYAEWVANGGSGAVMPFAIHRGKVHCRMFAPAFGIKEDPATGSGCGPLASYLFKFGFLPAPKSGVGETSIYQGVKPGGESLLTARVSLKGKVIRRVHVGGFSVMVGDREIKI